MQDIKQLEEQGQTIKALENKGEGRLDSIVEKLSNLERELSIVRNLAIRQPTGELLSDSLFGQGDHKYKAYRSPQGLTQPQRYSQDPVSGDLWIDVAEPGD